MTVCFILQTFQYDTRLNDGSAYLVADYTIQRDDEKHRHYVVYASLFSIVYCFGIPAVSLYLLQFKKEAIQEVQILSQVIDDVADGKSGQLPNTPSSPTSSDRRLGLEKLLARKLEEDPLLAGIMPLYQDYEPAHYWFEIPKFVSTLVLCGPVGLLPIEGASQVFISLAVSIVMMMLYANCKPYRTVGDDMLSQFCQMSLTFTMAIGILEKASAAFQVCAGLAK